MLLTDTEWLRFVTFAIVVGGVIGGTNVGALLVAGWPLGRALATGITLVAVLALVVHAVIRTLMQRAIPAEEAPAEDSPTDEPTS